MVDLFQMLYANASSNLLIMECDLATSLGNFESRTDVCRKFYLGKQFKNIYFLFSLFYFLKTASLHYAILLRNSFMGLIGKSLCTILTMLLPTRIMPLELERTNLDMCVVELLLLFSYSFILYFDNAQIKYTHIPTSFHETFPSSLSCTFNFYS